MIRFPGPICQTWHSHDIHDGTLARTVSAMPSTIPHKSKKARNKSIHCSGVNPTSSTTVLLSQAVFDRLRNKSSVAEISSPKSVNAQVWGKIPKWFMVWPSSLEAEGQEVQIDGQTIKIIQPKNTKITLSSPQQIVKALRAIPIKQRQYTSTVIVSPTKPRTAVAAEAAAGMILLYPNNHTQNLVDNRIMHESAHNYQEKLWREARGSNDWTIAIKNDKHRPSPYSGTNVGEDFCEFNMIYNAFRGTPCEKKVKEIYPHRWKQMQIYQTK